jgi:hypothetical protein
MEVVDEERGCGMEVSLLELMLSLQVEGAGETGSGGRSSGLGGDGGSGDSDWTTTPRFAMRSSNDGRDFSRRTPNPNIRF